MTRAYRWLPVAAMVIILIAAACAGRPGPASLAPTPEPGYERSYVMPAVTEVILHETQPVQVDLVLEGELPNPCARLGWHVKPGNDQGRIELALYTDQPTDRTCEQVVTAYSEVIPLGGFGRGSYGVFLNGELVEEFVLP